MKNFLIFVGGVITGIVLTFVFIAFIAVDSNNDIEYFEEPVSYENKTEASFQIFQVLGKAALAKEASDRIGGKVLYLGNTVVIVGENFYNDQIVTIKNPQRVGSFSYTNNDGRPMTVPVLDGDK